MPVRPSWMANAPALPLASSQSPPGQPHTTSASSHESQILRDPVDNSVSIRFMMGPMSTSIEFSSEEQLSRHGFQILQQAHSASLQLAMMSTQMSMNPTSHSMGLQMMPGAQNMMPSIMSATSPGATNIPAISAGATPGTRNQPALTAGDTPPGTRNQMAVADATAPGTINLSVNASDRSSSAQQTRRGVADPQISIGRFSGTLHCPEPDGIIVEVSFGTYLC